jgi:hypothetical protein
MLTGHGKTRAYLHRFKIRDNAHCVCQQGDQTVDHLLYDCNLLQTQREILRKSVTKKTQAVFSILHKAKESILCL